ncbi:hypothetical protein EVAR_78419_1 [Eumeta japonica]|uniref:Uncharacterized protein n=1 Tax=Eumeta variegata TaxID=151549 RepID=A0A4C1TY17_EUMVA|nr:hypothetical protein EVAR_78419_1 [Eumeta japonica]
MLCCTKGYPLAWREYEFVTGYWRGKFHGNAIVFSHRSVPSGRRHCPTEGKGRRTHQEDNFERWPLSLFYSDASADGVEERSLVPLSRSHARLRRNATMSHTFRGAGQGILEGAAVHPPTQFIRRGFRAVYCSRHIFRNMQTVTSTRVSRVLKLLTDVLPATFSDARHAMSDDTSKMREALSTSIHR